MRGVRSLEAEGSTVCEKDCAGGLRRRSGRAGPVRASSSAEDSLPEETEAISGELPRVSGMPDQPQLARFRETGRRLVVTANGMCFHASVKGGGLGNAEKLFNSPWRPACSQQQNALGYNLSMQGIRIVAIDGTRG